MIAPRVRTSLRIRTERPAKNLSPPEPRDRLQPSGAVTTSRPDESAGKPVAVDSEVRKALIRNLAYLRAERRGLTPGLEIEDWLAAEREIDSYLPSGG